MDFESLVKKVKEWQRSGSDQKKSWDKFCTSNGCKDFDPSRHKRPLLTRFIQAIESGEIVAGVDGPPVTWQSTDFDALVTKVKEWKRLGNGHKTAWEEFVQTEGSRDFDPNRHEESTLEKFLHATESGEIVPGEAIASANSPGPAPPWTSDDFDSLVRYVKHWQRSGFGHKAAWHNFCTEQQVATGASEVWFDPNKHEASKLVQFIQATESGEIVPVDAGTSLTWQSSGGGGKGGSDKESMVQRVKAWQKISDAHKESWYSFVKKATGTDCFDPNRHEETILSTFLESADSGALKMAPGGGDRGGKRKKNGGGGGGYGKSAGGGGMWYSRDDLWWMMQQMMKGKGKGYSPY